LRHEDGRVCRTILVVEDDPSVRTVIQLLLEAEHYRVVAVTNGAAALALAESLDGGIDLLVIDVVLPGGSGPALVARLRAAGHDLPVLYISGWPEPPEEILDSRAHFLTKPFAPGELARTIAAILDD
jgi:DNA-binding response OmpR family regulator